MIGSRAKATAASYLCSTAFTISTIRKASLYLWKSHDFCAVSLEHFLHCYSVKSLIYSPYHLLLQALTLIDRYASLSSFIPSILFKNANYNLQSRIPTSAQHTHSPLPCALTSTWWYERVLGSPPGRRKSPGKACHDQWLGKTFNAELRCWRHAASRKQQNEQATVHHKKGQKHAFLGDLPSLQVIRELR